MIFFCMLIGSCEAGFKILNNRKLNNTEVNFPSFTHGSDFYFPIYGRITYIEPSSDCEFNITSRPFPIFILTSLINNCTALGLISSESLSEVSLILFISDSVPSDYNETLNTRNKIQGIFVDQTYAKSMNKSKVIWASYVTSIKKYSAAKITYFLTSNYTVDRDFIGNLAELISKSASIDFDIGFSYQTENKSIYKDESYCYIEKRSSNSDIYNGNFEPAYCSNRTLLENSVYFIKLLHKRVEGKDSSSKNSISYEFLRDLGTIYKACTNDYSEQCIIRILGQKVEFNSTYFIADKINPIIPKLKINERYIYNNDLLFSEYCNSIEKPDGWCKCGNGCKYSYLKQERLYSKCNISECGYNGDLRGLLVDQISDNKCYQFMISDGNCDDEYCENDPDCKISKNTNSHLDPVLYSLSTGVLL